MKNTLILGVLLFLTQPNNIFAQVGRQNSLSITIQGPNTKIEGVTPEDASSKTQHLRFTNVAYKKATVGNLKNSYSLRYNIFQNEMEFMKDNKNYFLTKIEGQIIHFIASDRKFTLLNMNGKLQYIEITYEGNTSLYTLQKVAFKKGKVAKTQFETAKKAKFSRNKDLYYIKIDNENLKKLPKGKKDFCALFGDHSSAIKGYLKKEKIDRKKGTALIKVIKYYTSL
ncbi:MAG: hypothetical protein ACI9WV_002177 [Patiriisocius sp.]|jgi:hypothetical protein